MSVTNLQAYRKSKEQIYAERNSEKMADAWDRYDEIKKMLNNMPLPVVLKVMTCCRDRLKLDAN